MNIRYPIYEGVYRILTIIRICLRLQVYNLQACKCCSLKVNISYAGPQSLISNV